MQNIQINQKKNGAISLNLTGKVTLCSYVPKKNKSVILMSTMHTDDSVTGPKSKPEIIEYYNSTKSGVDNMDKLLTHYSTKRRTLRWPLALFYNIIDLACLASYIIYTKNNPLTKTTSHSRRTFLQDLGRSLAMPAIEKRSQTPNVTKTFSTKIAIESMIGHPIIPQAPSAGTVRPQGAKGQKPIIGSCYLCRLQQKKTKKN